MKFGKPKQAPNIVWVIDASFETKTLQAACIVKYKS
jgi:hypothetical protein